MGSDQEKNDSGKSSDKVGAFYAFLAEEVLELDDSALDDFILSHGGDFKALDRRMTNKLEVAFGKARMDVAKASLRAHMAKAPIAVSLLGLTLEQKVAEIKERLGAIGPEAALVYNRNYADSEDESEIDELLVELRRLDDRVDNE